MPHADIEAMHVGRTRLIDLVLKRMRSFIASGGTMNVIFVGQRGMGKTHMLQMIRHRLGDKISPAIFAQEEYSIYTVGEFFSRVLESINLDYDGPYVTDHARYVLKRLRAEGKPVVVFAENLQMLFAQMEQDLGKLRAVMQEDESFFIVGSALAVFGQVTSMSAPFYNFFEISRIDGLDSDEIGELVQKRFVARSPPVKMSLSKRRLDGLRILTGGNPRLVHMLCDEMIGKNSIGDLENDITTLLDQMTPAYQNRTETMPTEMRRIFDVLAMADGPLTPTEIAFKIGTKNTITAAQISRMKKDGLVEPVKFGTKKETRYQVAEWLYRAWREFRRNRGSAKLKIFVDFLKMWYSEEWLREYERMPNEFESGKQKNPVRILMRMSRVLAATEEHGVVELPKTVERFRALGNIDACTGEIENYKKHAEAERNKARRLCKEIITSDSELLIPGSNMPQIVADVQDKMQQLEKMMRARIRVPDPTNTHLLFGQVANIASKYHEWGLVEKVSDAALACIPDKHCHGCTMWSAAASTYLEKYKKAQDTLDSALRNSGVMDVERKSEILALRVQIHAKTGNRADMKSDSAYVLKHDVGRISDVVFAHLEAREFDEACKILQEHAQHLERLKPEDLETATIDMLSGFALWVLHRQLDEHTTETIAECLKVLKPFVTPNTFKDVAGILVAHRGRADEIRAFLNILSEAFADNQMGPVRILKCVTEYAATENSEVFEKIHQEERALAFDIVREMHPSVEIPQHVLDSASG